MALSSLSLSTRNLPSQDGDEGHCRYRWSGFSFWDEHVSEKDGTKVNDRWNARCCRATLSLSPRLVAHGHQLDELNIATHNYGGGK
jgi:hypothetical protein